METGQTSPLQLLISEPGADDDRIVHLTRLLMRDLREAGIAVQSETQAAPEGAKSAEALSVGAMVVAVVPHFLPQLIQMVQNWVTTSERRRAVRIKTPSGLEVEFVPDKDLSAAEMATLVKDFTTHRH
jgi:hypothetical protein